MRKADQNFPPTQFCEQARSLLGKLNDWFTSEAVKDSSILPTELFAYADAKGL